MAIIDIPIDIWNKTVDFSELTPPYEVDSNALSNGFPIKSGLIGTTALNRIFSFDENSPQIYPLLTFDLSDSIFNDVELGGYIEKERKNGYLWEAKYISVKPKVVDGYLDFDVNWADDYWLDENGLMPPKNCQLLQRYLFLVFGLQTELAKSQKTHLFISGKEHGKRKKGGSKNQEHPVKIGNITVTHYGRRNNSYERKTESWVVRGHWRHYKSGKSIFIQPFQKGDGNVKESVYKVVK